MSRNVTISNDPGLLGPDAHAGTVEAFARQLAAELCDEFRDEICVMTAPVTAPVSNDSELEQRVREICSSDEWIDVLTRAFETVD